MKKIFILFMLFFLVGCDYKEVTDSSFVTVVGIDKENDEYVISALIPGKNEDNTNLYKGKGFSISSAFNDLNLNLTKNISFSHLQSMVISEELAKKGTNELIKYFIQDEDVQKNLYFFISKNNKAYEILDCLLKNSNNNYNTLTNIFIKHNEIKFKNNSIAFHDFVNDVMTKGKDASLNSVTIKNNKVTPSEIAIFKDDKLVNFTNNLLGYSLLSKKASEILLDIKYKKHNLTVLLYNLKEKIHVSDKNIYYKIDSKYRVKENEDNIKIKNDLENQIKEKIHNQIFNLYNECKSNNTDIFGFQYELSKRFQNTEYTKINLDININLKYEKEGKYE